MPSHCILEQLSILHPKILLMTKLCWSYFLEELSVLNVEVKCPVFSCIRKLKVVESQMVKGMMLLDTLIKIEHRKQKAAIIISHHQHTVTLNQNSAIVASFRLRMANSVGFMVFD